MRRLCVRVVIVAAMLGVSAIAAIGPADAATCFPAGTSGYNATMIATANQTITGVVDGTGCDIGIYVGPNITGVTINGATVQNANNHGIFAINTTNLTIENSTIQNNGLHPNPNPNGEDKAVQLDGVSNSAVNNNIVKGNLADGGISIADYGPNDPGAINPGPSTPVGSSNDTVNGNTISGNYGGCAIVLAAFNPGGGLNGITANSNTVPGAPGQFGPNGPVIGQIVVATNAPNTQIQNATVDGNTITGALLPGIVLHANAPNNVITGTNISGNTLSLNNWSAGEGPANTAGIALLANPIPAPVTPIIDSTVVTNNTITQEFFGVWIGGAVTHTNVTGNNIQTDAGGWPIFTRPARGGGYWIAGSDGRVVAEGDAPVVSSLANSSVAPTAPIVGLAQSRDRGGYWLAGADGNVFAVGDATIVPPGPTTLASMGVKPAAPIVAISKTSELASFGSPGTNGLGYWLVGQDGGVFPFGDASFFGSTGGLKLNAPIVGIAPTADGLGYWLVASDGGVFSFGDAAFYGSMGGVKLNAPIVGIERAGSGEGYYLVASDGGVFTFGNAAFVGSAGNIALAAPIVGMAASPLRPGYWLVASDGGVFTFGAVPFFGSAVGVATPGTVRSLGKT
jgi:hypothetical protein